MLCFRAPCTFLLSVLNLENETDRPTQLYTVQSAPCVEIAPTFSTQWEIDLVFPSMPSQQSCLAKLVKLSAKQRTGPFLSTLLAPTVRNLFARVPKKTQFLVGLSILLNVWEPTCSTVNPLKSWGRKTLSLFGKRVKYQLLTPSIGGVTFI